MNLPQNLFDGDVKAQVFLCQADKEIISEIMPYDFKTNFKFNTYSEISFTIDKYYNDLFDGKTKMYPYYELIESLRVIYLRGIGHFVIQDVDEKEADTYTKSVTCFSFEYSTGQKYLENFYVNTGEEGSIETMYHAQQYGAEYSIDSNYTLVDKSSDEFDPYERYYIKDYSNNDNPTSYTYVEELVLNEDDYKNSEFELYVKKFPNVRFYWPTKKELSLLHHVFSLIPEWKIGHVDKELWYQERTFSEDRTAVYDFLYNNAAETLDFVMVWDSIKGVCNFYKVTEDGITANNDVDTQWNTDVFISRENLASALDIKYSTDDIKTKLKISGSDNLDVRDVNLGQNYILNLSYYNDPLWLGGDLYDKYNKYTAKIEEYTDRYKKFISDWSAAYNEYSDLMYYVPVGPRVMLVGDKFEKLYCVKNPYLPASTEFNGEKTYYIYKYDNIEKTYVYDVAVPQPTTDQDLKDGQYYVKESSVDALVNDLTIKLRRYKVDLQDNGLPSATAKTDDVLLTLEDDYSNSATIRVRIDQDKLYKLAEGEFNSAETYFTRNSQNDSYTKVSITKKQFNSNQYYTYGDYRVYRTRTDAATGASNTTSYPLSEWVEGKLQANYMNLEGFKIKSIGTLGAYFCLVRDEMDKANVEDYGIKLLEEKQSTYTKIFITQTEGYMNKEGSQCIASDTEPSGTDYADGTKWLDTDGIRILDKGGEYERSVLPLFIWNGTDWVEYNPSVDDPDIENYARFYENYAKLGNVQTVLTEKQLKANYLSNGVVVANRYIDKKNINETNLLSAAQSYFPEDVITPIGYSEEFGYVSFTIDLDTENEYAVYVMNSIPYISYSRSQGLCLAKMNVLKEKADMNNPDNFTEQELVRLSPFIREDEFSDSNFLLTSYESEEEQMNIKQELLKAGEEELKKICQPKLSFNATMGNILAIPEFAPIKNQFKLGNFVTVGIREGYVKRARLLEVEINFDDPSDFSCTFGDLVTTKSEIDKHAELLQQSVTVSKSVAANQSKWQKGADKAIELDNAINDGLKSAALSVGSADGQSIIWDKYGIRGRKLIDGTTNQYHDEQFALINNKLAFTTDNWKTSKAVVGEFEVEIDEQKQKMYGLLADALIGGYIQGTEIRGGNLRIGDGSDNYFQVDESGNVTIVQAGKEKYATTSDLQQIKEAYKYSIRLTYEGSTIFTGNETSGTTITAAVYQDGKDITNNLDKSKFKWKRSSGSTSVTDDEWNRLHKGMKSITVTHEDVYNNTNFWCEVDI